MLSAIHYKKKSSILNLAWIAMPLLSGCAGMLCSEKGGALPLHEIVHIGSGGGPTVDLIKIFPSGEVTFSELGRVYQCGELLKGEAGKISKAIDRLEIFSTKVNVGVGWQELHISTNGKSYVIVVDEKNLELMERLRDLDDLLDVSRKRKYPIIE